jgi:hypothetical protein
MTSMSRARASTMARLVATFLRDAHGATQAPDFYRRLGFDVVGRTDGYLTMVKRLSA